MFKLTSDGNFGKTLNFFDLLRNLKINATLRKFGDMGVSSLASYTPKDSGITASSWDYVIESTKDAHTITWTNSNINKGVPIAIILQYGHGTGWGGYVTGTDYINPAMRNIFNELADSAWDEVRKL